MYYYYIPLPIARGYSVNVDLIPRTHQGRCPKEGQYRKELGTCSCEEHCNWDACRLTDPPEKCLGGLYSKWYWDYNRRFWVAQVIKGIKINMKLLVPIQKLFLI